MCIYSTPPLYPHGSHGLIHPQSGERGLHGVLKFFGELGGCADAENGALTGAPRLV